MTVSPRRTPRPIGWIAAALLVPSSLALQPTLRQDTAAPAGNPREAVSSSDDEPRLGVELAAVGPELRLTFAELDECLVWRHGRTPMGVETAGNLLELRLIETLAERAGVRVSQAQLNARWKEIEESVTAQGYDDLHAFLTEQDVRVETFTRHLRLSILHETLTRKALGLDADAPLTGEQQTQWLASVVTERGVTHGEFPWLDGPVAACGDVGISREEFADFLRESLPHEDLVDACYELLLERRIAQRMPDLSPEAVEAAVAAEIDRRRVEAEADPRFQGVPYEQLLQAQGLSLDGLVRDPAIRSAALAYLFVDRTHDDAGLRAAYDAERELFDDAYGEAVEIHVLVLRAGEHVNELVPRTYEAAEAELTELRERIQGLEDFRRLVQVHSEDPRTRAREGLMGMITRGTRAVPEEIRGPAWEACDATQESVAGSLLGPLRVQGAVVLLCLGGRRPTPTWATMSEHVHRELRRRFVEDALPRSAVSTWLDV